MKSEALKLLMIGGNYFEVHNFVLTKVVFPCKDLW